MIMQIRAKRTHPKTKINLNLMIKIKPRMMIMQIRNKRTHPKTKINLNLMIKIKPRMMIMQIRANRTRVNKIIEHVLHILLLIVRLNLI